MSCIFIPLHYKEWKKLPKELQAQFKTVLKRRLETPHVMTAKLSLRMHHKISDDIYLPESP
jgi:mRNA-degrading endonuclease RelE of RelBE toxin-antitoxin system